MDGWLCCSVPAQHVRRQLFPDVSVFGSRQLSVCQSVSLDVCVVVVVVVVVSDLRIAGCVAVCPPNTYGVNCVRVSVSMSVFCCCSVLL